MNREELKKLVPGPVVRARVLMRYHALSRSPLLAVEYLVHGEEVDNFSYDIANRRELAAFVADSCSVALGTAGLAIDELDGDDWLRGQIDGAVATRGGRKTRLEYARRLGWYAITRLTKPRLVLETGVHDGLGSAVLLRAIQRNREEGAEGSLISFDIREDVGWLVPRDLRQYHRLVIGDSLTLIASEVGDQTIDLFIHDSDHRYAHEYGELATAFTYAHPGSVLMSDNSHSGPALHDFCQENGLIFKYFQESPVNHFYPGGGIGLAVLPRTDRP